MVLAAEKEVICYSRKDTFQGNWKRESVIDWENQMFKTTRKDLEENQSTFLIYMNNREKIWKR